MARLEQGLYWLEEEIPISRPPTCNKGIFTATARCQPFLDYNVAPNLTNDHSLPILYCSLNVWHQRLGHPSKRILSKILPHCKDIIKRNDKVSFCEACKFGKSHKLPFPVSPSRAKTRFELVHTDLWRPAPIQSIDGYNYYVAFLDDFSRYTWIFALKSKSDTFRIFKQFQAQVEVQYGTTIRTLRCDGGVNSNQL